LRSLYNLQRRAFCQQTSEYLPTFQNENNQQAKFDKKKDRKKPQTVHAAGIAKHGHAYPAGTARPHTVLGYSKTERTFFGYHFFLQRSFV